MGQAAVPAYVGHDFSACPPGHRFNLYFPVWNAQWSLDKDEAKAAALRKVLNLPPHTASLLKQLSERQVRLVQALPEAQCCVIDALSTAPFATGLGLEHPIENGFSFLSPYGLPYLAGSSVKGVLRRAAEELRDEGEASIDNALIDALFGPENTPAARRGALTCWDVLPQFDALTLEIMTPHQGHYLQGSDSPHDAGQPIPITFLALPAGSRFRFVLRFDPSPVPLACRAALADWQPLVRRIVQQAFDWLGFGAKTAVGYGAMGEDPAARDRRDSEAAAQQQSADEAADRARLALMTPDEAEWDRTKPLIERFTTDLAAERQRNNYKAGQGGFDDKRSAFMKLALDLQSKEARLAAAQVLRESYKFTDWPGKKERKQEVKQWLTQLDGLAP